MTVSVLTWVGLAVLFLAAFLLSLFHISLSSISKISLSRFLEDREKAVRAKTVQTYEETQLAVEFLRILLMIALVIFGLVVFPGWRLHPGWLFLAALAVYGLLLDFLPRLLASIGKHALLRLFLPAFPLARLLASPLLLISRNLVAREEQREDKEEDREATE